MVLVITLAEIKLKINKGENVSINSGHVQFMDASVVVQSIANC